MPFKNGAGGGGVSRVSHWLLVGSEVLVTKLFNISYEFQLNFNYFSTECDDTKVT